MTYKTARMALFNALKADGWKVSSPQLNVLHATSGDFRLWFKAQAVYTESGKPFKLGSARSAHLPDIRKIDPSKFVAWANKEAEPPAHTSRYDYYNPRHTRRTARRNGTGTSMSETQAKTIIQQLGGYGNLRMMLGKSLKLMRGYTDKGWPELTMRFPNKKGPNLVKIAIAPSDTYAVRFYRTRGYDAKLKGTYTDVYAAQLKRLVEKEIDLRLSFRNGLRRRNGNVRFTDIDGYSRNIDAGRMVHVIVFDYQKEPPTYTVIEKRAGDVDDPGDIYLSASDARRDANDALRAWAAEDDGGGYEYDGYSGDGYYDTMSGGVGSY
jgi:hypothetical protein